MDSADLTVGLAGEGARAERSKRLKQWLGYLFAAACLAWVFHDFQFGDLKRQIAQLQWKWVGLAVAADILSYLCQGVRWQLLLRPLGSISAWKTTQAIYVGLFANELLPMRVGELVRGYLASRWLRTRLRSVVPSMIAERFFDGLWLAIGIGLTALYVQLPRNLLEASNGLGILLLVSTGMFVYLIVQPKEAMATDHDVPISSGLSLRAVKSFIIHMASALQTLGTSLAFYLAFLLSIGVLVLQALAIWAAMLAYGFPFPFWVGFVVLLILHLGTAIPNAPSNLGTYQFFCIVALTLFGIDKQLATGFSVVSFIILTVPLWMIGGLALSQTGATLSAIRSEANRLTGISVSS